MLLHFIYYMWKFLFYPFYVLFICRIAVLFIFNSEKMSMTEFGKIKEIPYEIKQIEWEIPDFFSLESCLDSPDFTVADCVWYLTLYTKWKLQEGLEFSLQCVSNREYSVEYYLGLKKCDGSVKQFVSGILGKDDDETDLISLIEKTELLQLKAELAPKDILTVVCTMKPIIESSHSTQPIVLDEVKPLQLISKL